MLRKLVILAILGYVVSSLFGRPAPGDRRRLEPSGSGRRDAPRGWDMVDERSDESFPASDPPGTY